MIYSLRGKILEVNKDTIAIETGNIGYEVFVSRPDDFPVGTEGFVYTYEVLTQDDHYLVGFKTKIEKDAFGSLISVKGIGPKTAIGALAATTPDELFAAISANNTSYLKKLPGIGPKAAAQIILDLKGKLVKTGPKGKPNMYEDVKAALKTLGFKTKDIDDVLATINEPGLSSEQVLRLSLQKLGKK